MRKTPPSGPVVISASTAGSSSLSASSSAISSSAVVITATTASPTTSPGKTRDIRFKQPHHHHQQKIQKRTFNPSSSSSSSSSCSPKDSINPPSSLISSPSPQLPSPTVAQFQSDAQCSCSCSSCSSSSDRSHCHCHCHLHRKSLQLHVVSSALFPPPIVTLQPRLAAGGIAAAGTVAICFDEEEEEEEEEKNVEAEEKRQRGDGDRDEINHHHHHHRRPSTSHSILPDRFVLQSCMDDEKDKSDSLSLHQSPLLSSSPSSSSSSSSAFSSVAAAAVPLNSANNLHPLSLSQFQSPSSSYSSSSSSSSSLSASSSSSLLPSIPPPRSSSAPDSTSCPLHARPTALSSSAPTTAAASFSFGPSPSLSPSLSPSHFSSYPLSSSSSFASASASASASFPPVAATITTAVTDAGFGSGSGSGFAIGYTAASPGAVSPSLSFSSSFSSSSLITAVATTATATVGAARSAAAAAAGTGTGAAAANTMRDHHRSPSRHLHHHHHHHNHHNHHHHPQHSPQPQPQPQPQLQLQLQPQPQPQPQQRQSHTRHISAPAASPGPGISTAADSSAGTTPGASSGISSAIGIGGAISKSYGGDGFGLRKSASLSPPAVAAKKEIPNHQQQRQLHQRQPITTTTTTDDNNNDIDNSDTNNHDIHSCNSFNDKGDHAAGSGGSASNSVAATSATSATTTATATATAATTTTGTTTTTTTKTIPKTLAKTARRRKTSGSVGLRYGISTSLPSTLESMIATTTATATTKKTNNNKKKEKTVEEGDNSNEDTETETDADADTEQATTEDCDSLRPSKDDDNNHNYALHKTTTHSRLRGNSWHDSQLSMQRRVSGRKRRMDSPAHMREMPIHYNAAGRKEEEKNNDSSTSHHHHHPTLSSPPPPTNRRHLHLQQQLQQLQSQQSSQQRLPSQSHHHHHQSQRQQPPTSIPPPRASFFPTGASVMPDNPLYPSPNLYDLVLALNADPGIEAWWAQVVSILHTHYGAERATLTVPGDSTDLQNVPWGQKATYSSEGWLEDGAVTSATTPMEKCGHEEKTPEAEEEINRTERTTPDRKRRQRRDREEGYQASEDGHSDTPTESTISPTTTIRARASRSSRSQRRKARQTIVFPTPRELETEENPLIKRVGVDKLLGRTSPIVLTREYADDPADSTNHADDGTAAANKQNSTTVDVNQATPSEEPQVHPLDIYPLLDRLDEAKLRRYNLLPIATAPTEPASHARRPSMRARRMLDPRCFGLLFNHEPYEDYEQPLPSPWSQSPAPSPAPLPCEEENPFFVEHHHKHKVDETAFASSPTPTHDYSKVDAVPAIGTDLCKTIIHIPLLHSSSSSKKATDTIRFPVAIVSILTSIVPYPQNLRQSLAFLLPHLTTSFSLAQQYSNLEKQLSASSQQRLGHILGLGGTFSDASSELELVAELSGQAHAFGDESARSSAAHSTLSNTSSTPTETLTRIASAPEVGSEAVLDPISGSPHDSDGFYKTPSIATYRLANDTDSYFQLRKGSAVSTASVNLVHGRQPIARPRSSSTGQYKTEKEKKLEEAALARDYSNVRLSLPACASRHASSTSVTTMPRDIYTRPFPDTVAQLILNSIPLHLFLAKPKTGEVIWTNAKFDAYRGGQQRFRDPFMNVHEEDRPVLEEKWSDVLRQGPQGTVPCRIRSSQTNAGYRHFIFRANPLLSSNGEALYWIGSFLDVHEQRLREMEALSERERLQADAKYRAFTNSIPQIVFEAGEHRGLISVNDQWHLYTGQPVDDALNLGFTKFIHPDDLRKCVGFPGQSPMDEDRQQLQQYPQRNQMSQQPQQPEQLGQTQQRSSSSENTNGGRRSDATVDFNSETPPRQSANRSSSDPHDAPSPLLVRGITSLLNEVMNTGLVKMQRDENGRDFYITEIRLKSRLGEYRWHLVRLVKVGPFGHGEASWYGTCTDINDHKILEQSFNTAMEKLNIEMESKTKFFSNMSHEIRTPLNGILGTIPFLLDTQLDNEQRRMLDTIHNSSMNLRELVDNILDVSKVEAGKMNLVQQWFHLRSVLEDVMDTIGSRAIDRGLELNYLVDSDVPSMIIGDRFRIRQILINLVGNAVKFTQQGEIYTHCSIYQDPEAKLDDTELFINFDVVDTGKGFSKEEAKILMERFSQAQGSVGSQQGGTGLGLFLSKQLVEMHGGKLTPWSEGRGAKFSFYVKVGAPPIGLPDDAEALHARLSARDFPKLPGMEHVEALPKSQSFEITTASTRTSIGSLPPPVNEVQGFEKHFNISVDDADDDTKQTIAAIAQQLPATPGKEESPVPAPINEALAKDPRSPPKPAVQKQKRHSASNGSKTSASEGPRRYSILIVCPLEYARKAVKEHIEQVIPYDVPSRVKAVPEIDDWKDMPEAAQDTITHIVLSLQDTNDMMDVIQCLCQIKPPRPSPSLVVITDLYKRRELTPSLRALQSHDREVFVIPKPVKPSSFSPIFDPENKRDLSKDRNQDMVRAVNNNFRTMSRIVKEVIGNKGYRILLVEDDSTNLGIMLRYLDKVKLVSETASNGQECLDMVFSKEPGYYSLIICDIQMPVKDGYDTCREIRAWESYNHFPQIPIMALSANAMHDQIDGAARAGFNDYLTKPIKHNEFGKHMMELLVGSENGPAPFYLKERVLKS